MANSKVVLLLRVRLGRGKRVYAAPATAKNGKIKPLAAVIDGNVEHHPEGVYALRYRDQDWLMYRQSRRVPRCGPDRKASQPGTLRTRIRPESAAPRYKRSRLQTIVADPSLAPSV